MQRFLLSIGFAALPLAAAAAGGADFPLAGTWFHDVAHHPPGADGPYSSRRKVADVGIDGYRFALEATPLAEIAARVGAVVRRGSDNGEARAWLCLTAADQALYVYADGTTDHDAPTAVGLDNRGPAPASAGCAHRYKPIALDMEVLAPGTTLEEIQERYGLVMPHETGTFGYGSLTPIGAGDGVIWQGIAYHVTAGLADAYGVMQITND